jgi:hypothetical protein
VPRTFQRDFSSLTVGIRPNVAGRLGVTFLFGDRAKDNLFEPGTGADVVANSTVEIAMFATAK